MQCNRSLVRELFLAPKHVGETTEPNFIGRAASFKCGATLRLSLHIDDAQRITDAKFKAAGCSVLVASASLLIDQILNRTTAEAASLGQQPAMITAQLGALPAERSECPALACDALIAAVRSYSDSARDEWEGDEALICTCFCVSERTIEREIQTHQLQTIAEVTATCSAGGGCRSCYPLIQDMLDDHQRTATIITPLT
ncbi:MAG TPA: iron-sulfur cluster assembly scaffold protein [Pyrinomonadaceae bacterium]|nr:iron-sulfur cluster assembly scaffold protein [Pyrinomonadaceae bacterium]